MNENKTQKRTDFTELQIIRKHAREGVEQGAVTQGYKGDREAVIRLLNEALATELVCMLRYRRHYFMARGIHSEFVAKEFLAHSVQEQGHADKIAQRIVQLGGNPDFNPEGLIERSHAKYIEGETLIDMVKENLVEERVAIDSYSEMIRYIGSKDPTTRRMLEEILEMEEEHANDLAAFLPGL